MYIVICTAAALSTENKEHNVNVLFSSCIKHISSPLTSINLDCKEQMLCFLVEMLHWVGVFSKMIWVLFLNANAQSPESLTLWWLEVISVKKYCCGHLTFETTKPKKPQRKFHGFSKPKEPKCILYMLFIFFFLAFSCDMVCTQHVFLAWHIRKKVQLILYTDWKAA